MSEESAGCNGCWWMLAALAGAALWGIVIFAAWLLLLATRVR